VPPSSLTGGRTTSSIFLEVVVVKESILWRMSVIEKRWASR
jgi:hypothetical protein